MIKKLCGETAFKKGKVYYQSDKVKLQNYIENSPMIEARVKGGSSFHVTVKNDKKGGIDATCTCPPLPSFNLYCQHIAAVLLYMKDMQQDAPLANKMLDLFEKKVVRPSGSQAHFETRETLHIKFICKLVHFVEDGYLFGIQIKAGTQELYTIKRLREFLSKVDQGESYGFIYNPEIHSFQREVDAVMKELMSIAPSDRFREEDMIFIYPSNWARFLPFLLAVPSVELIYDEHVYSGIRVSKEPIPLEFEFDEVQIDGYRLVVKGLREIIVLPSYNYVLSKGKMIELLEEDCNRLAELKQMLELSGNHYLDIQAEQMDHFMETVIPGLMRIGNVQIAQSVSQRLVKTPLKAKLFLDRVKNRLLAGVEFHYGNLVINPFEETGEELKYNPTLRREEEKEQLFLQLMDDSMFTKTDGGFYIHDEEAEYNFLYHVVPTLEKWIEVYATSAVKLRIQKAYSAPRIKVEFDEKTEWLAFRFDIKEIPESEIKKLLLSLEEKRTFYRLRNGSLLSLETKEFQMLNQFIEELGITAENVNVEAIRLPLISGLQLVGSLQEGNLLESGEAFGKLMKQLTNPNELDFAIPESLNSVLRDYQKVGFQWFKMLAQYKFGGILADDMGLGKTIQSIAYIVSVLPEIRELKLPVLIVSPSSLIYNWLNELERFAPEIRACIVDGNKEKRNSILQNSSNVDVIITSYPTLRMDSSMYLNKSFHTMFLDEAQAFKNPTTQTARAVKKVQAHYRFALTGTPIENSLEELWSIFHVVFPNLLPSRKEFSELSRENIAKRVRPFILRRLKKDVLKELPEKIEFIQSSELSLEQKKLYTAYLAELKHDTWKHLTKGSFRKNRIKILAGLTRLRQLCCHPALFVEGYNGSSAKFDQLMEILEESRIAGRRVLIFSQFTKMLDIIGRKLGYYGVPYFYLDGQTPPIERVELCRRFNEGEGDLFLISLKAGGTGLNLTGADTVILYDLWWNPAVEQQAADRAYRMGQENDVHVIKLVAKGTIEEKMNELQEKKKNLIGEIIQPGQEALSTLTEQDIKEILMLE